MDSLFDRALGQLSRIASGSNAGKWLYTPQPHVNSNDYGKDIFWLLAWDGQKWSNTVCYQITIQSVHTAPVFTHQPYAIQPNTRTWLDLAADLHTTDGDYVHIVSVSQPSHGKLQQDAWGDYYYTPQTGYRGTDQFIMTLSDGKVRNTATVQLQIGKPASHRSTGALHFKAATHSSTSHNAHTANSPNYVVLNHTATQPFNTQPAVNINWSAQAATGQLQAPIHAIAPENTNRSPSLAELTGLVIKA